MAGVPSSRNWAFCFSCKHFSDVNTVQSTDKFSDWSNLSVPLAEHEKFTSHLQASVQWFEAEQKLTKCFSVDSIYPFYHLLLHQTFIVFCLFASVNTLGRKNTTSKSRYTNVKDT